MRRRNWKKINTQGVKDIHPARRGSFTTRDLRSTLAAGIWQRLSLRRKQAAGAFLALAIGAFLIGRGSFPMTAEESVRGGQQESLKCKPFRVAHPLPAIAAPSGRGPLRIGALRTILRMRPRFLRRR